ncbi:hypothetical protein [Kitasatospora sp. MMS16-BH015]|nr:hypothetical protein [Kitasatospora sp. MMS16-BH015]
MGYQFDTARAAIDERLRVAEEYRRARAARQGGRVRRAVVRRLLSGGNA